MSILFPISAIFALGQGYPSVVPLSDASPELATAFNVDYHCRAETVDETPYEFSVRYSGPRGYTHPETGETGKTDAVITFDGPSADIFSSYDVGGSADRFAGFTSERGQVFGDMFHMVFLRMQVPSSGISNDRVGLEIKTYAVGPHFTYALGFCERETSAQEPLTELETREYLAL